MEDLIQEEGESRYRTDGKEVLVHALTVLERSGYFYDSFIWSLVTYLAGVLCFFSELWCHNKKAVQCQQGV